MKWFGATLQLIAADWTRKRAIRLVPLVLLALWAVAEGVSRS